MLFNTTTLSLTLIFVVSILTAPLTNHQGNDIGDLGANDLASAFQHNNTLTWLDLSGKYFQLSSHPHQDNTIGASGATALASALQNNNTLTWLDPSGKYFSAVPSPTSRH
jgi:hypothetical protein